MFEILVPGRFPEIELALPPSGIAGYFKWELVRDGKIIRDSGGFHKNLITNGGMDRLAADAFTNLNQAKVGTGATAPAFTDIGCTTPVGTFVVRDTETATAYVAGPPDYLFKRITYKWLEANGNGNLTEIGLHMTSSGTPCFSHQLFKDGLGVPTVVTKTNLDQLFVTYEYRVYPYAGADINSVAVISGINYDVTMRPCNVAASGGWASIITSGPGNAVTTRANSGESNVLVARTAAPSVGDIFNTDSTDHTLTPYVNGNYYVENKYVWDIAKANYPTGIGLIALHGDGLGTSPVSAAYQFVFPTTKIPKTNVKKLTMFIRKSWARFP